MNSAVYCAYDCNTDLKYILNGDGALLEKLELCATIKSDLNGEIDLNLPRRNQENNADSKTKQEHESQEKYECEKFFKEDEFCDDVKVEETQLMPATIDYQEYEPSTVAEQQHAESADKSQLHKCVYCERFYGSKKGLKFHYTTQHKKVKAIRKHKCSHCECSYSNKSNLNRHITVKHQKEKIYHIEYSTAFMCNMCGEMFKDQSPLDNHVKMHMLRKNGVEIYVRKSFNEDDEETQHKKPRWDISKNNWKHEFSTSFICDVCEEMFISQSSLENHMENIHVTEVKHVEEETDKKKGPFRCEHCGKISLIRSTHIAHLRKHTNERPYKCNRCNKQFSSRGDVERHVETHNDDRPFQCHLCLKRFATADILKMHGLRHEGKYQYHCDVCNKGFHEKRNLVRHGKIHSGHQRYKCATCEEIFETLIILKRHAVKIHGSPIFFADDKTHSNHSLYQCVTCKESYSSAISLKRHSIEVHEKTNADDEQTNNNKAKPNEDEAMSEEKVVAQLEKTKSGVLNDEENIAKETYAEEEFISIKQEEFLEEDVPQTNGNEIQQNYIQIISRKIVKIN